MKNYILIGSLLVGSIGIYIDGIPKIPPGGLQLAALGIITVAYIRENEIEISKLRSYLLLVLGLYIISGILPGLFTNISFTYVRSVIRYSFVIILLSFGGVAAIKTEFQKFVNVSTILSIIIMGIGILTLLLGDLQLWVFNSSQYYPIWIGDTPIPTSQSVFWNINYYSITLLVFLSLFMGYGHSLWASKHIDYIVYGMFIVSIFHTDSRSGWVIFITIALLSLFFKFYPVLLRNIRYVIAINISAIFILLVFLPEQIYSILQLIHDLILSKGLNNRGELFVQGWNAISVQPLGYGFGQVDRALTVVGLDRSTVQNTYLTILLMGGPLQLVCLIIALLTSMLLHLRIIFNFPVDSEIRKYHLTMFLIIVVVSLDGLWRTYILGGSGAIPFTFSVAIISSLLPTTSTTG